MTVATIVVVISPGDREIFDNVGVTRIALLLIGAAARAELDRHRTNAKQARDVTALIAERPRIISVDPCKVV